MACKNYTARFLVSMDRPHTPHGMVCAFNDGTVSNAFDTMCAASTSENLYISSNNGIVCYASDGSYLYEFGKKYLLSPSKLYSDVSTGRLYVIDSNRIVVFNGHGAFIASFGGDHLKNPTDITMCKNLRHTYVTDSDQNCVQVFDHNACFISSIGKDQMHCPVAITSMSDGNLLVAEQEHRWLSIWTPDGRMIGKIGDYEWEAPSSLLIHRDTIFVFSTHKKPVIRTLTLSGHLIQEINLPSNAKCMGVGLKEHIFVACADGNIFMLPFARFASLTVLGH